MVMLRHHSNDRSVSSKSAPHQDLWVFLPTQTAPDLALSSYCVHLIDRGREQFGLTKIWVLMNVY